MNGPDPAQAAANFIPQTAGLAATLITGYLADRFSDRLLIISSPAIAILPEAQALAWYVTPGWSVLGYGVAIGLSGNRFRIIEATAFPSCFGLTHIGAIRGVIETRTVAGSAFGPLMRLRSSHPASGSGWSPGTGARCADRARASAATTARIAAMGRNARSWAALDEE